MWPGYEHVVYADTCRARRLPCLAEGPGLDADHHRSAGHRGLTAAAGSLVWWILPQDIKDLITGIINLGMMMLVMFILMQVMKPLTSAGETEESRKT